MTPKIAKSGSPWVRSMSGVLSVLGAGALLLSTLPAMAQSADSLSSDVDSTFGDNDGLDMFDLMHRAQQGQIRNPYEFSQDQQESISQEAADFRTRQIEAVQQEQSQEAVQPAETNPVPTTQPEGGQL